MRRSGFKQLSYEEKLTKARTAQKKAQAKRKLPKAKRSVRRDGKRMIYGVKVWTLKRADTAYSKHLREQRGYTCERCGYYEAPPTARIQVSHYLGRSYKAVRFDDDNCDVLCATCHYHFENAKQYEYREWKLKRLGQEHHDALWQKANNSEGEKHAIHQLMQRLGSL